MIVILHPDGCERSAQEIALALTSAFRDNVSVVISSARSPVPWPCEESWDDVLIVLFTDQSFPDAGSDYIAEFLRRKNGNPMVLPTALDCDHQTPPKIIEAFKSLPFDAAAKGPKGRLCNRVGAMLGLRVRAAKTRIFISYSVGDGREIAKQLSDQLTSLHYDTWMDEAREIDNETKILPGSKVQQEIDEALVGANLVLLVDTPAAPHSKWIKHEVDTANSLILPILPLCFRDRDDRIPGPRFRSLLALQRWVPVILPNVLTASPIESAHVDRIVQEMELLLCEIFQRRCRVPFLVRKEFVARDFAWRTLDQRLLMFESKKQHSPRLTTKVVSHCSIFQQIHAPALKRFTEFLDKTGHPNRSLYIYEGDLLPEPELQEIIQEHSGPVLILHHQELALLLDSNFSALAA